MQELSLSIFVTYLGMEVPLIIIKLILNTMYFTDIKYYLILHYIKLGMKMYKHNVLIAKIIAKKV